jgi:glycosyltransferase involved in cell wall biosynthesis
VSEPRVAHLVPRTDDAGAENQARFLIEGMLADGGLGHDLVYFNPGDGHEAFEALGIPMLELERRRRTILDGPRRIRALRDHYGDRPPAVLQTWLQEGNILGCVAARAWPETKVVITEVGGLNDWDHPWHMRAQRLLLGRVDHALSNSKAGAEVLVDLGLAADRVTVVPNAVPADRIEVEEPAGAVRERLGLGDRPLLAWAGRMSDPATFAQKDVVNFIAAVREVRERHPDVVAVLVRPTPEQLAENGVAAPDYVRPLGFQPRVADILAAADVVVSSSYREGNSVVVSEALMIGRPVATTDAGDHAALVAEAGGAVAPVKDPAALADAIDAMLERPPDAEAVRKLAAGRLSVDALARTVLGVYRELGV